MKHYAGNPQRMTGCLARVWKLGQTLPPKLLMIRFQSYGYCTIPIVISPYDWVNNAVAFLPPSPPPPHLTIDLGPASNPATQGRLKLVVEATGTVCKPWAASPPSHSGTQGTCRTRSIPHQLQSLGVPNLPFCFLQLLRESLSWCDGMWCDARLSFPTEAASHYSPIRFYSLDPIGGSSVSLKTEPP